MGLQHFSNYVSFLTHNNHDGFIKEWKDNQKLEFNILEKKIEEISKGLLSLGLNKSNTVAIYGEESIDWVLCDLSIMSIGGITVPIHYDSSNRRLEKIINEIECRFIFVSNDEEIKTILKLKPSFPKVLKIISFSESEIQDESLLSLDQLINLGNNEVTNSIIKRKELLDSTDIATIVYTSGSSEKGVVLSHEQIIYSMQIFSKFISNYKNQTAYQSIPLSHIFGKIFFYSTLYSGLNQYINSEKFFTSDSFKTIKPNIIFTTPIFLKNKINKRLINFFYKYSPLIPIYNWAYSVGLQYLDFINDNIKPPLGKKIQFYIARNFILNFIKKQLGGNLNLIITIDAPLNKASKDFYNILGIPFIESYGISELCGITHIKSKNDNFQALDINLESKSKDQELFFRSNNVMIGYYQNEELKSKLINHQNWLSTDDLVDSCDNTNFHFLSTNEAYIQLNSGKNANLLQVETLLLDSKLVNQVIAFARKEEDYISLLIHPEREEIIQIAQKYNIEADEYEEICEKKEILDLFQNLIDEINIEINIMNRVSIKFFALIPEAFDRKKDLISDTGKVKRKAIIEKYQKIIDHFFEKRYN